MERQHSASPAPQVHGDQPPKTTPKPKTRRIRRTVNGDQKRHFGSIPGRRSSIYRGVTRHRWTGRYEAHLWDKNCWNQVQNKKGRQVYLGAYDDEEAAAHTYDLAALKYWGPGTILNFPLSTYVKELEEMQHLTKEEYLATLRRRSSGFSRGVSKYRGVARHHHNGRWEARIGRVFGNKYLYLGTYSTQEEAAAAYDIAAIEYRGLNAVTNFDLSHYIRSPFPQPTYTFEDSQTPKFPMMASTNFQIPNSDLCDAMVGPEFPSEQTWAPQVDCSFNGLPDSTIFEDIDFLFDNSQEEGVSEEKEAKGNVDNTLQASGSSEGGREAMGLNHGDMSSMNSISYPCPISICS
ncbi:hypothetical protein AMTRI_Chr01g102960 [Amborella trichopoda]